MMISKSRDIRSCVEAVYDGVQQYILGDGTFTLKIRVYDGVLRPISRCHIALKQNV